ncbi:penicillin-binding protein 2 [Candidatus Peregrinibacteria bacterium]|nr:penicillin-binding protein 2 [Candidatus Peregrinibacteria bacterium]
MAALRPHTLTETQKRRSLLQRMTIVYGFFLLALLIIVARLIELQIVRGEEYNEAAQAQHYGDVRLPAKRGEILGMNSKTGETNVFATNATLDLIYVDPALIQNDAEATAVAETLADTLLTEEFHEMCSNGKETCPRELIIPELYASAFDPLLLHKIIQSGSFLEPIPIGLPPSQVLQIPDLPEARRLFARNIERRISEKRMTFVPLLYGATKVQMQQVEELGIEGIIVNEDQRLIYGNPEAIRQSSLDAYARALGTPLELDPVVIRKMLRTRPLRYVPVMHRLPPSLSLKIKEHQLASLKEAQDLRRQAADIKAAQEIQPRLRSIALIQEHWRFYPDTTIASHVVGFLNTNQEAQYGIERTFNPMLRGQAGRISTVSDPQGGQILTADQTIVNPKDGDTVVLTIDRSIQKEVETIMEEAVRKYQADSGQVIVMDPDTGRIIAMVNAPLFDSNNYAIVYEKEPIILDAEKEKQVVVEVFHPETNARILKAYIADVFTEEGRKALSEKTQKALADIEALYNIEDVTRYYLYLGENNRREIFPTQEKGLWLKYKNNIGVGAYLNRTIQEIYEPGSVMKPVTMAIAIDQGEVTPMDIYDDTGPVKVDEFTIKNALLTYYGKVTMTNCLELSINTCMTSVGFKLGPKLFHRALERFGFGHITGIELEDELPGEMKPWRKANDWPMSLLATTAFGQGISATPLQMVTAFAALANGGKLMRPTIIDRIVHADGTVEKTQPRTIDQVITPETSDTITAMLISSVNKGYAKPAKVKGYQSAGKTGTSQIAGPGGKYETGTGSTVASFIGYAPAENPRFIALVKLDRPKAKNITHGAQAAAPVFHDIAEFLIKYYGLPPDDKTGGK